MTKQDIIAGEVVRFSGKTFSNTKQAYDYILEMLDRVWDKSAEQEHQRPIGVSQWREMGKKHGYWDYFAEQEHQKEG